MDRIIGFNEQELNDTLKRIDGLIRFLMEHNLPLIYEVISDPQPNNIAGSHAFACKIFNDMLSVLAQIESQLTELDGQNRCNNISLHQIQSQINKFRQDRNQFN